VARPQGHELSPSHPRLGGGEDHELMPIRDARQETVKLGRGEDAYSSMDPFGKVCAAGFDARTRSRTARAKMPCSSVWYFRTDPRGQPPSMATVTHAAR
jgi:hypothetical protein